MLMALVLIRTRIKIAKRNLILLKSMASLERCSILYRRWLDALMINEIWQEKKFLQI